MCNCKKGKTYRSCQTAPSEADQCSCAADHPQTAVLTDSVHRSHKWSASLLIVRPAHTNIKLVITKGNATAHSGQTLNTEINSLFMLPR